MALSGNRGFEGLPGDAEQKFLRMAGAKLGVSSPYFLMHEGDAGAETVIDGKKLINFSSYDYLGLNHHPDVRRAAVEAIERYGVSASASRLVAGERPVHRALEAALGRHYGQESCLTFVSGHGANVSAIGALMGPRDLILHDSLSHNSIVVGAQLSRAERRAFAHNDMAALEKLLASLRDRHERALIVVEGLYSMDGDVCDLPALVELKQRYGAWLMVDEAHGLGVLGPNGRGVFEHYGMSPSCVDIWMGTLSKTLASCGGFIAGPAALTDYLRHSAGGFVFSVAMAPALAASALKALEILESEPERVTRLKANSAAFAKAAVAAGLDIRPSIGEAVIPVVVGSSLVAMLLSRRLADRGVNVQPIVYPAVPEGLARLRFFISSEHDSVKVAAIPALLAEELPVAQRLVAAALNGGR